MFELNGADYYAAENCKNANALATKGIGRSVPLKWEDASVVHEDLKGIKMVICLFNSIIIPIMTTILNPLGLSPLLPPLRLTLLETTLLSKGVIGLCSTMRYVAPRLNLCHVHKVLTSRTVHSLQHEPGQNQIPFQVQVWKLEDRLVNLFSILSRESILKLLLLYQSFLPFELAIVSLYKLIMNLFNTPIQALIQIEPG